MLAQVCQRRVTYLQNAGNTSVQGVAVEIAVRMTTLAVVLALFTASAVCSTCSSENITLLSPVPAPTLASSLCDETMKHAYVLHFVIGCIFCVCVCVYVCVCTATIRLWKCVYISNKV